MATAQAEREKKASSQTDIASLVASLASRQGPASGRRLTGTERAAVLMLALGEQHGEKIWGMLDDEELREISVVMLTHGKFDASCGGGRLVGLDASMSGAYAG